jgi:hypothetical protein
MAPAWLITPVRITKHPATNVTALMLSSECNFISEVQFHNVFVIYDFNGF